MEKRLAGQQWPAEPAVARREKSLVLRGKRELVRRAAGEMGVSGKTGVSAGCPAHTNSPTALPPAAEGFSSLRQLRIWSAAFFPNFSAFFLLKASHKKCKSAIHF